MKNQQNKDLHLQDSYNKRITADLVPVTLESYKSRLVSSKEGSGCIKTVSLASSSSFEDTVPTVTNYSVLSLQSFSYSLSV